jgi:hypothetical protein
LVCGDPLPLFKSPNFNMLLGLETANTTYPSIGFCIERLLGSK